MNFHTGSIDGMVAIAGLIRDEKLGVFVPRQPRSRAKCATR